ncbi:MAG: hypothetical protein HY738_23065 [Bacteroidia bacterium]|nr:hypothetical protein [Bacteroidia bacterium]
MLHYLPAFIILIANLFTYGFISHEDKANILLKHTWGTDSPVWLYKAILYIFQASEYNFNIQVIIYIILMIVLMFTHRKNINKYFSYKENISLNCINTPVRDKDTPTNRFNGMALIKEEMSNSGIICLFLI